MLTSLFGSTDDPKRPGRLTKEEAFQWNKFRAENPDLEFERDLSKIYARYKQRYPQGTISLPALQNELSLTDQYLKQEAAYRHQANPQDVNSGYAFPVVRDDKGKPIGVVTGDSRVNYPTTDPYGRRLKSAQEIDADVEWDYDPNYNLPRYADPQTGDWIYAQPHSWNDPRFSPRNKELAEIKRKRLEELMRMQEAKRNGGLPSTNPSVSSTNRL